MTDPKEKDPQQQEENNTSHEKQSTDKDNGNWDAHQQVDEEGNQVDPEDIK
ncbi:hypothetical protein [Pedobacter chinensis]|uniref:hypothetical protein n=1 Tax=Pedobacter chinensis TaxID=2282421 RepID=UPI0013147A8A|nr:hypothetical protein [Pedobacter chinensis]